MEKITVVSERRSIVGEGPHWDSRINELIYVDIENGIISRLNPTTKKEDVIRYDGHYVSLAVPFASDANQLIISRDRQLCRLDWESKETIILEEVEVNRPTRLNDGKCDSKGRLWAGTMGLNKTLDDFPSGVGNLYSFGSDFNIKKQVSDVSISNGLAWDTDAQKMFYIDSLPKKIYVFDYEEENGTISNQKTLVDFSTDSSYANYGLPDGMTIDENKKLWVACFKGSCVLQIDPDTGVILRTVTLPTSHITSCCFGGPNYDKLYVTSAYFGLNDIERKAQPIAGAVFEVKDLGVKGLPANNFAA